MRVSIFDIEKFMILPKVQEQIDAAAECQKKFGGNIR